MRIDLNRLPSLSGRKRDRKRVGRGQGSGKGSHTTGRGAKGQKIRGKVHLYFEGGQLPITKRLPHQKGFKSKGTLWEAAVKLSFLNVFEPGAEVTLKSLKDKKIIGESVRSAKIIGGGVLEKKLVFKGIRLTKKVFADLKASESVVS